MQVYCGEPSPVGLWRLEERELDLEDLGRRGCEEFYVLFHRGFLRLGEKPVNPILTIRGSAGI